MRVVFDKVGAEERKEFVRRAQELFAEGCPRTRNPPRHPRRDKGTKRSSTTKASIDIGWLARRRSIVTVAAKLPRTHNLVGAGHVGVALLGIHNLVGAGLVGVALPGTHNLVGAAHVGAAELPQGLGREQRKCLAKQQQQNKQTATGR